VSSVPSLSLFVNKAFSMEKEYPPKRKHPPHFPLRERDNQTVIHFVTVCTKDRRPLLASPLAHQTLLDSWQSTDSFQVGRYVLMPDHLHLFCTPATLLPDSLPRWIRYWKSLTAARWPHAIHGKLWQRDFWDTQLRHGESYANKWDYVRLNPVRHKLVTQPQEWPYQGEVHPLEWHEK